MKPRWPAFVLCSIALALALPLGAQTPERVLGAPYHNPGRAFIDLMIPHHEMAVMMSQHAVAGGRTDGVRQVAQKMLDEQTAEIGELKALRRSLFGSDSTRSHMMQGMMQTMGMHQMRDTAAARARMDSMRMAQPMPMRRDSMPMRQHTMSGDFDRMFLEHMILHHQDGADMSVLAEDSQAGTQVKELARKIRGRQEQDIAEMRRLLAALPPAPAQGHDH